MKKLLQDLKKAKIGDDPLSLKEYDIIRQKFDPKKDNVGKITRKTIMACFSEFLKSEGLLTFKKCWSLT